MVGWWCAKQCPQPNRRTAHQKITQYQRIYRYSMPVKRCPVCREQYKERAERHGNAGYCSPEHAAMAKYLIAIPGGGFALSAAGVKRLLELRLKDNNVILPHVV